ncbi:hypothetical protein FRC18_001139 [Serendipita sp. 400]|nr:hypothetical protein FRC18_001139 [Serendipita sp. 400]
MEHQARTSSKRKPKGSEPPTRSTSGIFARNKAFVGLGDGNAKTAQSTHAISEL